MSAHPATGGGPSVPSPVVELLRRLMHAVARAAANVTAPPAPPAPAPAAPARTVEVRLVYWGGPLDGDQVEPLEVTGIEPNGPAHAATAELITRAMLQRRVAETELAAALDFAGTYRTPDGDRGLVRFQTAGAAR